VKLAWVVLVAACEPAASRVAPDVLTITETEQTAAFVRNFNPLLEVGNVRWPARNAMYEPLVIHNPMTGAYVPWLARAYEWNAEHTQLRFELRPGIRWSDGQPFSAHDVVFTFKLLARHPALDMRGVWRFLGDVKATGDLTVVFSFPRPNVPSLYTIGHQPIVPRHIWSTVADPVSFANEHPVATGPFTEVSSFSPQAYQVERNPHYWIEGRPRVRAIRFLALPANDQGNLALLRGDVDWGSDFMPAVERIYVERDPLHRHYWFPAIDSTVFLYANTARPPFGDVRVRKAISMAIDRTRLVKIAMFDYVRPADATGLNDAWWRWHSEKAVGFHDWTRYDPQAAQFLLDEAGARGLQVVIDVPAAFSDWIRAAQVIARDLRHLGIDATFRTWDYNTWYEKVQKGEFQMTIGWSDNGPTPYGFYRALMSQETARPLGTPAMENWHRFGLPAADAPLHALERTSDPDEESRLYGELQALFVEHAPAIPLFPGPLWSEYSTARFVGFPDRNHPYAPPSPNPYPQSLLVLTEVRPRGPLPAGQGGSPGPLPAGQGGSPGPLPAGQGGSQ
jgi:peptide/nickel transport system substrate-binding protein